MVERISRRIIQCGIFFVPFIPLIVTNSMFFPFITGKAFAFRITVEIIFAAWLLLIMRDATYRPRRSLVAWALAGLVGIMGLATIFGESPLRSFWSNFERMEGYVTLLHLFAYFLVLGSFLKTEQAWKRLFATTVGVSAFIGLYVIGETASLFGTYHVGARLGATFGNPTYLAVYMLFHIFLALWLLYRARQEKIMRLVYAGALLLQFFALYHTATRGTILGVIGGLGLAALYK